MSNPYVKSVRHLDEIDIYQIGNLYEVKSHAVFHALKKLLCAGKRGAKDYEQDLMEAIESIERELQIVGLAQSSAPGGTQECGFRQTVHVAISESGDQSQKIGAPGGSFLGKGRVVAVGQAFDEQRIDVIGQNGGEPHYDDWRMKVDWSLASPHHQWASRKENGDYGFSMHEPMQGEYIRRPVAQ